MYNIEKQPFYSISNQFLLEDALIRQHLCRACFITFVLNGSSILIVISIHILDCNKALLIHEGLITLHLNNGNYFYKPRKNAVCLVSNLLNPKILCYHAYFFLFGLHKICVDVDTRTVKKDFEIELGYWKYKNTLIQCVNGLIVLLCVDMVYE